MRLFGLPLLALALGGEPASPAAAAPPKLEGISVLATTVLESENGRVLTVEYVSKVGLSDERRLAEQVSRVWGQVRAEAERVAAVRAVLMPYEKPRGRRKLFMFERNAGGWSQTLGSTSEPRK